MPRIIRLFKKFNWPFTLWLNSRAIEASAQYGPVLVEIGCDMAGEYGCGWKYDFGCGCGYEYGSGYGH